MSTWRCQPVGAKKLAWRIADWWADRKEKQRRRQEERERQKRARQYEEEYRRFQVSLGVNPETAKADVLLGHPEDDCFACEARRELLRSR